MYKRQVLTAEGKPHEFHTYSEAGHAFFAVDRPAYRVAAANDGWVKVAEFFGRHLSAGPSFDTRSPLDTRED